MRVIVVVDRRTYKKARRLVAGLLANGDVVRAKSGITAMEVWLRYERHFGSRRRRVWLASELEKVELMQEEVNMTLGLTVS